MADDQNRDAIDEQAVQADGNLRQVLELQAPAASDETLTQALSQMTPGSLFGEGHPCSSFRPHEPRSGSSLRTRGGLLRHGQQDVGLLQQQGWFPPASPLDHNGRDTRDIPTLEDTIDKEQPWNDTMTLFADAIAISEQCDKIIWKPDTQLGKDDARAKAPTSTSPVFSPPGTLDPNLPSLTSRGHQPKYQRPERVGAGWGGYDLFHEWQLSGRHPPKEQVKEKEKDWIKTFGDTFTIVPSDEDAAKGAQPRVIKADPALLMPFEVPQSLYEQMESCRGGPDEVAEGATD
ncbi:hypothetical protein NM208_g12292 [Fusarium decemcellulare]|uniref:Uncharacterized protein n=1 Tax=Fusarium decemcellulare TaxID=57161 RepID=A0ACC1RPV1_9HYPO|nr:hypothetical protein NM208_g12292 [Fusarium decemcellulare]